MAHDAFVVPLGHLLSSTAICLLDMKKLTDYMTTGATTVATARSRRQSVSIARTLVSSTVSNANTKPGALDDGTATSKVTIAQEEEESEEEAPQRPAKRRRTDSVSAVTSTSAGVKAKKARTTAVAPPNVNDDAVVMYALSCYCIGEALLRM